MRAWIHVSALTLAFTGLASAAAGAASPFAAIDAAHGQLPKTVVPTYYQIDVAPDPKTMKIAGHEVISIVVRRPVQTIVLNALQTSFGAVTVDGKPAAVSTNEAKQQATFSLKSPLSSGAHTLDIAYTAILQTKAQGLFKQGYSDLNGKPAFMYGTQLEMTDARRMFPSWDEPAYRPRYRLSFVVPKEWMAVSNTPITATTAAGAGLKRVSFAPTPPMQSYLVVLCAGDFDKVSTTADGIKLSVYATRGKGEEGQYALSVMKDLMPYYDSYYGVKFPIAKLDTIAIPGGFLGAMENWGGVTYNESFLLYNPQIQPQSDQRQIFDIIAHEESHQWNGDLTSFAWWDDVWIAEGFATWMQTKAPDHFHPEWHMYIQADNAVDRTLDDDAQVTTHSTHIPVNNETEAAAVFDDLSYTKAGAVLRMFEQYVGPDKFQGAMQHYFRTHQYMAFSAKDLWADIGAAGSIDAAAIAHNWIYAKGFPMVTATAACDNGKRTIALTQQRYLSDVGIAPGDTVWSIPLNVKLDATSNQTTPVIFKKASQSIAGGSCDAPYVINGDSVGYYRTQYDDASRAAQQASFLKLSTADRLALLHDSISFAKTGHAKIDDYLAYAKADVGDTDPLVVGAVLAVYGTMLDYEKDKPGESAAKALVISRVKPMLQTFGGWDGTGMNDDQLAVRNSILMLLARSDDPATIAEGKARFAKLVAEPKAYTPLNKQAVFGVAGYAADATIYKQLFGMAMGATNPQEQLQLFFGLFGANEPALAEQNLQMTAHLPPQFAPFGPYIVAAVGHRHPKEAWKYLVDNHDRLFAAMSASEMAQAVTGVGQQFATLIPADQIAAYFKAHVPPDGAPQVKHAMDIINTEQVTEDRLLPQLNDFLASQAAEPVTTTR